MLTRISGFRKKGLQYRQPSVGDFDKGISRMTITAVGTTISKLKSQDSLKSFTMCYCRDYGQQKHRGKGDYTSKLMWRKAQEPRFRGDKQGLRAKVVDFSPYLLLWKLRETSKCVGVCGISMPYGIAELCRTGITAISRGCETLKIKLESKQNGKNLL